MKKIILVLVTIICVILSFYCGKQVAFYEDEEYIDDLLKLSIYSEELLDLCYEHDSVYYLDSISNTDSYQDYINLHVKLFNE